MLICLCDQMMSHAWSNYEKYAWGANELDPIAKSANYHTVFGIAPTGSTIVDALDTLYIMGMRKEFEKASEWVKKQLDFDKVSSWDSKKWEWDKNKPNWDNRCKMGFLKFSFYNNIVRNSCNSMFETYHEVCCETVVVIIDVSHVTSHLCSPEVLPSYTHKYIVYVCVCC